MRKAATLLVSTAAILSVLTSHSHTQHALANLKKELVESQKALQALRSRTGQQEKLIACQSQRIAELEQELARLHAKVREYERRKQKEKRVAITEWRPFRASFYNLSERSTGKRPGHPAYGITKSGRPAEDGVTIAVDPNVIPLGSWVEIKYPDGRIELRRADDTGSRIKGHQIDIFMNLPTQDLLELGVMEVEVRIVRLPQSQAPGRGK